MMKTRAIASLGLSALVLGGTMVGCAQGGGIASASSKAQVRSAKQASDAFNRATKAMAKGDTNGAIRFAEVAVAAAPQDAGYRALLAQSYLKAGRFASAQAAFADVLTLNPSDDRSALNLALAQIALGDWDVARETLAAHADGIAATDRGLAMALAGDTAGGVELLLATARQPDATAKTRQNLALAMALAGRWQEARALVGVDLAPAQADARMVEWAAFAKPDSASQQVATLLGVTPARDPGLPIALALSSPVPVGPTAPVEVATVDVPPPPVEVQMGAWQEPVALAAAEPVDAAPVITAEKVFKTRVAATSVTAKPAVEDAPLAKGNYYVQLGAFDSAGVARDAWGRAQRRMTAFGDLSPTGMTYKSFYRLSVGGFARTDAVRLCGEYRAKGGRCFVRAGAGDQVASWVKPSRVQMAAR